MKQWEDHIEFGDGRERNGLAARLLAHLHKSAELRLTQQGGRRGVGGPAFERAHRVLTANPFAGFRDADKRHVIFIFVNGPQHRPRRHQRDFMLTASSTEDDSYPYFLSHSPTLTR